MSRTNSPGLEYGHKALMQRTLEHAAKRLAEAAKVLERTSEGGLKQYDMTKACELLDVIDEATTWTSPSDELQRDLDQLDRDLASAGLICERA